MRTYRAKLELTAQIQDGVEVELFFAAELPQDQVEHWLTRAVRNAAANLNRVLEGYAPGTPVRVECKPTVYVPSLAAEHVDWARPVIDRVLADFNNASKIAAAVTPRAQWANVVYDDRVSVRPRSWLARLTDRILRVDDVLNRIRRDDSVSPL